MIATIAELMYVSNLQYFVILFRIWDYQIIKS